ncbi:MAG: TonB-dependent receptor [Halioglobus sp.]
MINRSLKPLAVAVVMANAGIMMPAMAQTGGPVVNDSGPLLEEVIVTGIRSSLKAAADLKRDSAGVVDAITAEDMGKFPDTNLAESLQRITGVSIDRVNGEGSKVTVRGFGPDFNAVTLNGRMMPSANLEDTSASASRSFDFAQLSSDAVSAVEVYKTGKARLASGGLGSTINIQTLRPLDKPGLTASLSGGALHDTTNDNGDDVTPEVSGIYSNSFFDDTVGIAINGSYQERDSGIRTGETSSGWNTFISDGTEYQDFINPPKAGDVVGIPQNFVYTLQDVEQKRTNYQLTLQWEPIENLRATLDYTYSEFEIEQHRQELSAWFGGGGAAGGEFTVANGVGGVVAPVVFNAVEGPDSAMAVGDWGRKTENDSTGFNLEWSPTDNLTLALDYHDSTAEAKPKDDRGSNNTVTAASFDRVLTTMRYNTDMAKMVIGTANGLPPTPDQIIGSGNSFRNSYMKTDVEQTRLDGTFHFDEAFAGLESIDFGLNHADVDNRSAFAAMQGGNWGSFGYTGESSGGDWNAAAGDGDGNFDNAAFSRGNLPGQFDDLGGANVNSWYYDVNYKQFTSDVRAFYDNNPQLAGGQPLNAWADCRDGKLCAPSQYTTDRKLTEEQNSAYMQLNFHWDLAGMSTNLALGLRYDDTDVDSNSRAPNYNSLLWLTANELQLQAEGATELQGEGGYDYWLPNIDFDIEVIDDVVLRASYSETISRPNYTDLQAGRSVASQARTDADSTGFGGDPGLEPFESENFDFSAEWYYAEGSYVSVGYYLKKVDNFIGTGIVNSVVYPELVQPVSGPRYAQALASVENPGDNLQILDYYRDQGWVDEVTGVLLNGLDTYDPLSFALTIPVNSEDAEIDGFELAAQHMFGESGFGFIVNYTTVDGDIDYDDKQIGVDQFALLGLSDSYNVIAFYDKNGYQARMAYNWRDDFLDATVGGNNQQEPIYVEDYGQLDLSLSYTWDDRLTVYAEGINLTEEDQRKYGRHRNMVVATIEGGARYSMGVRYKF